MGRRSRSSLCGCLQVLCIGFAVAIVRCDFAVGPSNQAVVAGRRMEMECRASNGSSGLFKWALTRITSDKKQNIFRVNRRPNSSNTFTAYHNFGYSVDEDGSGIIFKNSTNPEDAGIYFCYDYPGQMQFSAHLIVFESEPLCHVNYTSRDVVAENATMAPMATKGEEVLMSCRVNYRGLWRPSVEWRRHTADGAVDGGKVVARDASMDAISSDSVSSSLDILIDFDLTTYFSFRLFFRWPIDLIPVNASNVPEYSYEWRSPELVRELPKIEPVVQVIVETVTSEDKSTGDWYLVSLVLLVVVPVIVFSIAAVVVRRCYISYRRTKGLDQRPTPAKSSFLDGLERPASGEYDVIPYAAPNIYDRIDDEEANERGTETQQQQQPQQKQHPPLTQCYSHLSEVALLPPSNPYDTLTPYLSMESVPNSPGLCPLPEIPLTERCQNRYTEVARRGNSMVAPTTATTAKDNYLTLVGEGEAAASASDNDNEDSSSSSSSEEDASVSVSRFAKGNGDYLIPFV